MGTTDIDLFNLMKKTPFFNGVYASDKLPSKLNYGSYIMNLDTSGCKGSHWVGMFNFGTFLFYFDPLTLPIQVYHYIRFRRQFGNNIIQSSYLTEQLTSSRCGQIVVAFLKEATKSYQKATEFIDKHKITNIRPMNV